MKNNQNITQQIQTNLKHLGALLFLLLTVIVLINCSEDGGISDGGVSSNDDDGSSGGSGGSTTLEIVSATVKSYSSNPHFIELVFSEVVDDVTKNNTTLTCTAANGGAGQTAHNEIVFGSNSATKIFGFISSSYTAGETCTLTLTKVLTGEVSGATLPAGTVLFTGVLPPPFTYNNPPVADSGTQSLDITFSEDLDQASITASDFSISCTSDTQGDPNDPNDPDNAPNVGISSDIAPLVSPEDSKKLHVYLDNYGKGGTCTLELTGEISSTAGNKLSGVTFNAVALQ